MSKYGIILAAGKGSRMKSENPKVIFEILGKPMVNYVYDNLVSLGINKIIPIVGHKKELVLKTLPQNIEYALQEELLGTGHAIMMCKEILADKKGHTIIMAGDQPMFEDSTLKSFWDFHIQSKNDLTLLTTQMETPDGYGRIIRENHLVTGIVESKDCTPEQSLIKEVNVSTYIVKNELLFKYLDKISCENAQKEYYITDLIKIFNDEDLIVRAYKIENNEEAIGINDRFALGEASVLMQKRINKKLMIEGVTILDSKSTYIGPDVKIGTDSIIYPNSLIFGKSEIGNNVEIKSSYIFNSNVGDNSVIGPYSHLREYSNVGENCRIGNFVELKKATIGNKTNAAHLTYLGDALIGDRVNIGCGVVTVNYDGKNKHLTTIESDAFIGSNVNLVAPITVSKGAIIAAGSTINIDVPKDSLAIARPKEIIKEGYANIIRKKVGK